jgi:hypothetical protein
MPVSNWRIFGYFYNEIKNLWKTLWWLFLINLLYIYFHKWISSEQSFQWAHLPCISCLIYMLSYIASHFYKSKVLLYLSYWRKMWTYHASIRIFRPIASMKIVSHNPRTKCDHLFMSFNNGNRHKIMHMMVMVSFQNTGKSSEILVSCW